MIHSRLNVDFGRGFYVTPLYEQASKWCNMFFDGLIEKAEAINRLRYERPNLQFCFRTERALGFLRFEGSEMV